MTAAGLLAYSILICLLRTFRVVPEGWVPAAVAIPCFAAGVWYGCLYFSYRDIDLDWGLLLSGLGWLSAGMAFLTAMVTGRSGGLGGYAWFWAWMAALLIIAGGVVGWFSVREMQAKALRSKGEESAESVVPEP